jgi:hypothetical protein
MYAPSLSQHLAKVFAKSIWRNSCLFTCQKSWQFIPSSSNGKRCEYGLVRWLDCRPWRRSAKRLPPGEIAQVLSYAYASAMKKSR